MSNLTDPRKEFGRAVSEVAETAPIDYQTVETEDPESPRGEEAVTTEGVEGEQTTTFRVTVVDGVETAREQIAVTVTRAPVDEQVRGGDDPWVAWVRARARPPAGRRPGA